MQASQARRAVDAASAIASALGLPADDATVLHDSNKLTVRLLPADVVARIAPTDQQNADFEIEVARRLAGLGAPVAELEPRVQPRVHQYNGFVVTLWRYYRPLPAAAVPATGYAEALRRLHSCMREVDVPTPHFTDRVASAQRLIADRDLTPALAEADRQLLGDTLSTLKARVLTRGGDQLLHGEPHPGNLLNTAHGPLFIDFETCCRGPVEFDLAHAPDEVVDHYPGLDVDLLRDCRILMLAMITSWRWDRDDQLPNGRQLAADWLGQIRAALEGDTSEVP
jgi:hypothetical protein